MTMITRALSLEPNRKIIKNYAMYLQCIKQLDLVCVNISGDCVVTSGHAIMVIF